MSQLIVCNAHSRSVSITVRSVTGDHASISYDTLPGNQPNTNGNYVALWPSTDEVIPWDRLPADARVCAVFGNEPAGDLIMGNLELPERSYVVGYSLAPKATKPEENNFCASVFVPSLKPGTKFTSQRMSLQVLEIASFSAMVRYTALPGATPKDHGSWIGVWDAKDSLLHDDPLCAVPVNQNCEHGEIALNNFPIISGHKYTVAYFTGGYDARKGKQSPRTQMACIATFDAAAE